MFYFLCVRGQHLTIRADFIRLYLFQTGARTKTTLLIFYIARFFIKLNAWQNTVIRGFRDNR